MPPKLIYIVHQPFFTAATEHKIDSAGGSSGDTFTVDASYDFSVNAIIPSAYDLNGSLFDQGVRSDLFEIQLKSDTTGTSFQNKAYDLKTFKELVTSGGFPGMYLPKGSILTVTVNHKAIATGLPPAFPVTVKMQFFGSLRTAQPNPEYQAWVNQNRR